jgi:iron complex outermembrane receptor protein
VDVADAPVVVDVDLRATASLTPVTVVGTADGRGADLHLGSADVLTSVSVVAGEQIAREQVEFAQELLRKVPGVYQSDFNQGIVSGDVGIRGFNTESDIASTKLLVDGIPTNLNSGLGEFNALFPLEIDRMEIVRGTNDPRWGLFNLAGNVGVTTRRGGTGVTTRLAAGSFGTTEAQALGAFERGGFSQTYFGGARRASGYRENAALDKLAGSGKWFYTTPGQRVTVGAIARVQALDTDAPGYLTTAEARATPRFSPAYTDADGGTVDTRQVSLHADVRQTATLAWSLRAYDQTFDRVRWVRFTAAGAQQERLEDERQRGALAQLTWRPAALAAHAVVLSGGADWQAQDNVQQRYRTADRVREATLRDYDFTFGNGGGYVRADARLAGRLALDAGLRLDRVTGEFRNRQTNAALPVIAYGWIPQPKASATLTLAPGYSVYGNYGRSFQVGTGPAAYGTQPIAPSKNDGYEAGVVTRPLPALSLRAAAWRQDASDEVRLRFDNSGDSENIGRTRREGLDVEGGLRLGSGVSLWGTLTTQRAVLVEPGPRNAAARGKTLNHVPGWTAKYGADWTPTTRVTASFWAYGQGDYHLTDLNDLPRYGGYTAVNADLSYRVRGGLSLGVALQNALDRYYEYVWNDGARTLHSPANPRALFVTLTFDR